MIGREVFEQTLRQFFAPVRQFLDDPTVSEIMINGPFDVRIERKGRIERTDVRFDSHAALTAAIFNLAQFVGRHVDEERPILEARFPDGSRAEAILPPIAPDGPHVSIRRFFHENLLLEDLLALGSLTPEAANVIAGQVACKQNVVVAGGAGSGKTSLLNMLSSFIEPDERVIVIEDSRELKLQQSHVVQLEARPPDQRGRGAVTIRDLFRASLRMRPDRIVIGEVRGEEALDLLQAMTSGHSGSLATVHATYPRDTLNRLETMALMGDVQLPLHALRAQLGSAINVIVQTARLADGSRCVTHVTELRGHDPKEGYQLVDLFVRHVRGRDPAGRVVSELVPTGVEPACADMMRAMGYGAWPR